MEKWIDKVAVVTGASAGIGKAIAIRLAKNGITVIGLCRRVELVESYAKELGDSKGKVYAKKCDVSNLESVKSVFKWIEDEFNSISILVNNAAFLSPIDLTTEKEGTEEKFHETLDTNLFGPVYCARATIKLLKKSGDHGIIININSTAGHVILSVPCLGMYAASKYALNAFSEHLRLELARSKNIKIRVSNISPAGVKTDMLNKVMDAINPAATAVMGTDLFPVLQPEDLAQTVQFLLETPYTVNINELSIKPTGDLI